VLASGFFGQGPVSAHYIALKKDITINGQPDTLGPSAYSTRHFPGIFNGFARFRPYTLDMWEKSIEELLDTIQPWLERAGLRFVRSEGPILAGEICARAVSATTEVLFEPAEFAANKTPTIVRIYGIPYLRQVFLVGPVAGVWEVTTTSHVPFRMKWNESEFLALISDILNEPVSKRIPATKAG